MSSDDRLRPGTQKIQGGSVMVALKAHWVLILVVVLLVVWWKKRR